MLKLYSLPYAVELKGLKPFIETFDFIISHGLIKFVLLFLQKCFKICLLFYSLFFDVLCLHPDIVDFSFVLFHKLMVSANFA
jgi:hypothetical protein